MKLFVVFVAFIALCIACDEPNIRKDVLNYEFNGIIQKTYTIRKLHNNPAILVNDKEYLTYSYSLSENARVGDSIVKRKNEMKYMIVRKDTTIICYPSIGQKELKTN